MPLMGIVCEHDGVNPVYNKSPVMAELGLWEI